LVWRKLNHKLRLLRTVVIKVFLQALEKRSANDTSTKNANVRKNSNMSKVFQNDCSDILKMCDRNPVAMLFPYKVDKKRLTDLEGFAIIPHVVASDDETILENDTANKVD